MENNIYEKIGRSIGKTIIEKSGNIIYLMSEFEKKENDRFPERGRLGLYLFEGETYEQTIKRAYSKIEGCVKNAYNFEPLAGRKENNWKTPSDAIRKLRIAILRKENIKLSEEEINIILNESMGFVMFEYAKIIQIV